MGAGERARRASESGGGAVAAVVGQDDLDLDGNWAFGDAGDSAGEPDGEVAAARPTKRKRKASGAKLGKPEPDGEVAAARPTKRKRKASGAKLGKPAKASKTAKIASRAAAAADDSYAADDLGGFAAAVAAAEDSERNVKKKRKKKKKKPKKQRVTAAEVAAAGGLDSCGQARARLAEAWAVEAKACSLSKLEMRDRVFEALAEVGAAWKVGEAWAAKPLALAAHGGGRRKDQVARQAKAIAAGVAVAVGTPGRVLRLLEEKHLEASGLETIVVDLARDRKERDVLTLPETRRDFFALCRRFLSAELRRADGSCRLVMCSAPAPKGS